ncbi:D-aminoacylase [Echinicola strongylocentroti]|uniref:D-aminoacylase n=1 Tax=Echinicola strongylocentroti TaxID=1795355 RepID=A0A2Z4INZ2_9BACT|nr:D-aminoacylase [Echinicola strongylocentroti]AWW32266.1 D-aminoacylase [Echinicola strongylocentroti]
MENRINRAIWGVLLSFLLMASCKPSVEVDVLITGGMVLDGSNALAKRMEVGITDDKISYVGAPGEHSISSQQTIDIAGLYLAPGFIDPHTHVERELSDPEQKANLRYLRQGVTTVFAGNDGSSPMPIKRKLDEWERNGIGTNAALLVGHGSVRRVVMGMEAKEANPKELKEMEEVVNKSMEEGAFGISTGLFYAPGSFANMEEVIALSKVVAKHNGIYDTHMRDEGSYNIGLMNAVRETIAIGKKSGVDVHISHIKCLGTDVWDKSPEVIKLIEKAREQGVQVTANQYPYLASRTSLKAALVPRWAEDGGYDKMVERFDDPALRDTLIAGITENLRKRGGPESLIFSDAVEAIMNGNSLGEMAKELDMNLPEATMEILRNDGGIKVISFNMKESDLERFMQQPWVMTGSDGGAGHPRQFGTFPRKMHKYVAEDKVIDLPFMVHSSSGLTAETFGVKERGFVKEGYFADLIVFDPEKVKDRATFEDPYEEAEGMEYVWVNGELVIDEGKYTGKLAGKALRK